MESPLSRASEDLEQLFEVLSIHLSHVIPSLA